MTKSEVTYRLRRDKLIRLDGNVAIGDISCREGILWLTQTGNPGDHLIQEGETFCIDRPGLLLISALTDSVFAVACAESRSFCSVWSFVPALRRMSHR